MSMNFTVAPESTRAVTVRGAFCHNPFPELSPTDRLCPVLPVFTPFLPCHALQATPIDSNHAQPCPVIPPCHIVDGGQNLGQNAPPQPLGLGHLLRSCGHHVMIVQPHTTKATSSVDLGPEVPAL